MRTPKWLFLILVRPAPSFDYGGLNIVMRSDPLTSVSTESYDGELPNVTVVTRSGFRPACFNNLQGSLAAQETGFRQVVSNDANTKGLEFLQAHAAKAQFQLDIVDLDRTKFWQKGRVQCASSRYLNTLYRQVPKDSWIMTLDDDSRLVDAEQLLRVRRGAARADPTTDILLQDAYMWTNHSFRIYPNYTESKIVIDTANFIFHQSAVRHLDFGPACGGDKVGFRRLLDAGYRTLHLRTPHPGVWANYAGPAHQRLVSCDIPTVGPVEAPMLNSSRYNEALVPAELFQHDAERHQAHLRSHNYRVPKPAVVWRQRRRRRSRRH